MSAFCSTSVTSAPGALTSTRPSVSVPVSTYTPPSVMVTSSVPESAIVVALVRSGAATSA